MEGRRCVCSGGLERGEEGRTQPDCPPACFTAQHLLGGHGVLRWPSPSGRRKEGSQGDAHTLASLDGSLWSQGGWLRVGRIESPTSSWRPDSIPQCRCLSAAASILWPKSLPVCLVKTLGPNIKAPLEFLGVVVLIWCLFQRRFCCHRLCGLGQEGLLGPLCFPDIRLA